MLSRGTVFVVTVQLEHVPVPLVTVLPIDATPSVSVPTVTVNDFVEEVFAPTATLCV
jgi:hypothetical protein